MTPVEIIVAVGVGLVLVILYKIFRLLERILDLLLRSLPLDAVALLQSDEKSPFHAREKRRGIPGFREVTVNSSTPTDFPSEHEPAG